MALIAENKDKRTRHIVASERLEGALLSLEKAIVKNAKSENSADLEKIAALAMENDKLLDINKAVEERLNGAIKNLKNIIKEA